MNELIVFENNKLGKLRSLEKDGMIYFIGKEVASILGYANTRDALKKHIDTEDKAVVKHDTARGKQNMTIINESGLYALILSSKMPKAKEFKRWVTSEVLPKIRKHGAYITEDLLSDPELAIQVFKELKKEREKIKMLNNTIENQKGKVAFANSVESAKTSVLVGDLAKILRQAGFNIGQNRLFKWLRDNGYLIKVGDSRNLPTQRSMEKKLFEIKERTITSPSGRTRIIRTPKVTAKGQIYFVTLFTNEVKK